MSREAVRSNRYCHVAGGIEGLRLGGGRGDQAHAAVVEGIDQIDEAAHHVARNVREHGDGVDQHGVEGVGDVQEVVGAERSPRTARRT